jgi:hypothetical protein
MGTAPRAAKQVLNATSCPRLSNAIAVRLQSSSLPPQELRRIVEKNAIRIASPL